jgi:hypothetical protein
MFSAYRPDASSHDCVIFAAQLPRPIGTPYRCRIFAVVWIVQWFARQLLAYYLLHHARGDSGEVVVFA